MTSDQTSFCQTCFVSSPSSSSPWLSSHVPPRSPFPAAAVEILSANFPRKPPSPLAENFPPSRGSAYSSTQHSSPLSISTSPPIAGLHWNCIFVKFDASRTSSEESLPPPCMAFQSGRNSWVCVASFSCFVAEDEEEEEEERKVGGGEGVLPATPEPPAYLIVSLTSLAVGGLIGGLFAGGGATSPPGESPHGDDSSSRPTLVGGVGGGGGGDEGVRGETIATSLIPPDL